MSQEQGMTIGEMQMQMFVVVSDKRLKGLRTKKEECEVDLMLAERRIPEHIRDIETLELHLEGCTKGELKLVMEQFISNYRAMAEYVAIRRKIKRLERIIDARLEQLGVPNTSN